MELKVIEEMISLRVIARTHIQTEKKKERCSGQEVVPQANHSALITESDPCCGWFSLACEARLDGG